MVKHSALVIVASQRKEGKLTISNGNLNLRACLFRPFYKLIIRRGGTRRLGPGYVRHAVCRDLHLTKFLKMVCAQCQLERAIGGNMRYLRRLGHGEHDRELGVVGRLWLFNENEALPGTLRSVMA